LCRLKEAEQKAATLEDELAPLQSALRQCEADKAAVTSEVQELTVTVATWKTRVETLTRQYKLVDPDDHARVTVRRDTRAEKEAHTRTDLPPVKTFCIVL
jgi:chromosome segregation ATPase